MPTFKQAEIAKNLALQALQGSDFLVGVGITSVESGYGLKVNLNAPLPNGVSVPPVIQGVPVTTEIVGALRKRSL